jgi:hypothetical protein
VRVPIYLGLLGAFHLGSGYRPLRFVEIQFSPLHLPDFSGPLERVADSRSASRVTALPL